jgi:hypothetical protein
LTGFGCAKAGVPAKAAVAAVPTRRLRRVILGFGAMSLGDVILPHVQEFIKVLLGIHAGQLPDGARSTSTRVSSAVRLRREMELAASRLVGTIATTRG